VDRTNVLPPKFDEVERRRKRQQSSSAQETHAESDESVGVGGVEEDVCCEHEVACEARDQGE
jgi:hypothetical protein